MYEHSRGSRSRARSQIVDRGIVTVSVARGDLGGLKLTE